jgi:hypothetical protein
LSGNSRITQYDIRRKGQYSSDMETKLLPLLAALDAEKFMDEREAAAGLMATPPLSLSEREEVRHEAEALVRLARRGARRQGGGEASCRSSRSPPARAWP